MTFLYIITPLTYLLSAFFSASETALFSIPLEERSILAKGTNREQQISALLMRGEETLIIILMGNVFVNILAISLTGQILAPISTLSLAAKVVITTLLLLILGEIIPKNIAIMSAYPLARFSAPILVWLKKVLFPAIWLFKSFNRFFIHLNYHYFLQSPAPYITADEYEIALKDSVKEGTLSQGHHQTLSSYLVLCQKPISTIAIHRSRLENRRDGSSFSLLYAKDNETITGITATINGITTTEEADWFPITQDMGTLHHFFIENKRTTVLLSDEYGDFYGIATLNDFYTYWQKSISTNHTTTHHTTTLLEGNTPLIEVTQWLPQELLQQYTECKTVNGLLTSWLQRIPQEGENVSYQSYIFVFEKCAPNRIVQVRVQKEDFHD